MRDSISMLFMQILLNDESKNYVLSDDENFMLSLACKAS